MQEDLIDNQDQNVLPLTTFQSDDFLEKLKMLGYEKHLLKEFKMKALSRFYFVKSFNPGEQFYMFTLICWWLCKKLGKDLERPQEFDDPNTVIARIMQVLEDMDVPVTFQPNKLIRGAGPACLFVLDCLATQVMKVAKISFQRFVVAEEDEIATDYLEDNAEIVLEKLDDEQNVLSDDSDMELDGNTYRNITWINRVQNHDSHVDKSSGEHVGADKYGDRQQWRMELERVLPQLKVFVKADVRDWRTHQSQMETLKTNIEEISDETQSQLKKLYNEFTFSQEKIESREKHLNNELQQLVKQLKEVSIELSNVQYAQTQVQTEAEQLMTQLQEVTAENEAKKAEMEQRGQSMSNGSSVVQIKKAIVKLRDDVAHLNLEVALLVHGVDQEILRQAGNFEDIDVSMTAIRTF